MESKLTTLAEEKKQAGLKTMSKDSIAWLKEKIVEIKRPDKISAAIRGETFRKANQFKIGMMYCFFYDPKTKATLPYYDKFPLVFPFSRTEDGFIGLNMHYLPHKLRFVLLDRLLMFKNNEKFDESTKLKYSWAAIDGMSKFALAKPCVKRYLSSHMKSPLHNINSDDWATAMMLPVERFVGASQAAIWADSRNKI